MKKINSHKKNINKNILMLVTTIIYILGLSASFSNHTIIFAIVISIILGLICHFNFLKLKYLFVWLTVFYLGVFNATYRISETDVLYNIAPINGTFTGEIVSIPNSNIANNSKFFFKVSKVVTDETTFDNLNAKVLVNLKSSEESEFNELKIAGEYEITGSLRRPFKPGNPSQFDYGKYLRNYNAHTVLYSELDNIKKLETTPNFSGKFLQKLNEIRGQILTTHRQYLKSPNLELLGGIVFGDDAVAPPDYIKASFINSGLLHILAASGMNVAFIYGFWFIIAGWFKLPFKVRIAGGIPLIIIYSMMTGLGASVVRAAIMIVFVLAGKLIDRDAHSIALLSFVAFLMLLYNPSYINDVSFQLSFIVTFGILVCSPLIIRFETDKKFSLKEKSINFVIDSVSIPLIAQIWVMPIQMFYFNTISIYSIFANILTVPFLAVISFGGFVSSILATIPIIGSFICKVFDFILNPFLTIIVKISGFFASLPNSLLITPHPSILQILLYYTIILILTYILKNKVFNKKSLTILGSILLMFLITFIHIPNRNLEIIFFDVQNADCILLKTPKNEYFMIDTGKSGYNGGKSQAEFIVTKYLKDRGIKHLNSIIVTHFDNDHAGGTVDMINYGNPERVYLNSNTGDTYTAKSILKELQRNKNTQKVIAKNNEVIYSEPNLSITNYISGLNEDNENSIITLLKYYNTKILFTGDAGVEAFNNINWKIPDIDILKVPHHGADRVLNKEILNKLSPNFAVISVGKNLYGHPSTNTLNLLKDIPYARTDRNNSIKIVVNSKGYKVYYWDMKLNKYNLYKINY